MDIFCDSLIAYMKLILFFVLSVYKTLLHLLRSRASILFGVMISRRVADADDHQSKQTSRTPLEPNLNYLDRE